MKKILSSLLVLLCLMGMFCSAQAAQIVPLFIDANGGTFHTSTGFDLFAAEQPAEVGCPVSSVFTFTNPTSSNKDFTGWYVYDNATYTQIPGTGLLTTQQVLDYILPETSLLFEAQWKDKPKPAAAAITYAAVYNGIGDPDYNVRITIVNNGVRYSGNGFVSIPKSVYSTWSGTVEMICECPGEYIDANLKWNPDYFYATCSAGDFIGQGDCYWSISTTGSDKETPSPRDKIDQLYYDASFVAPEISYVDTKETVDVTVEGQGIIPEDATLQAELFTSGETYDRAVQAVQGSGHSGSVAVFDIALTAADGTVIHQLSDFVEVRLDLPEDYQVQPGNTVTVFYLADDGTLEECETVFYSDDPNTRYVIYKTNHFSLYLLTEVPEPVVEEPPAEAPPAEIPVPKPEPEPAPVVPEPIPPKNNTPRFAIWGGSVALLAIMVVVIIKSKKK